MNAALENALRELISDWREEGDLSGHSPADKALVRMCFNQAANELEQVLEADA